MKRTWLVTILALGVLAGIALSANGQGQVIDTKRLTGLSLDPSDLAKKALEVAWVAELGKKELLAAYLVRDLVYVETTSAEVYALDRDRGAMRWRKPTSCPLDFCPANNGPASFLVGRNTVSCISNELGALNWQFALPFMQNIAPLADDKELYLTDMYHCIRVLDLDTREELARFKLDGVMLDHPSLCEGVYYATTANGHVYALGGSRLRLLWKFDAKAPVEASPFLAGGFLYLGTTTGELFAIDVKTGQPTWRLDGAGPIVETPYAMSDTVFVACRRAGLYAVDAAKGKEKWCLKDGTRFLALGKRNVYVLTTGKTIAALDPATGQERWRWTATGFELLLTNPSSSHLILVTPGAAVVALKDK